MKILLCMCAVWAFASADENDQSLIVGGSPTTIEEHPYIVGLHYVGNNSNLFACGGNIYSKNVIVTAAHCVNKADPKNYQIVAGTKYTNGTCGLHVGIKQFIVHEKFGIISKAEYVHYDVALIVLASPLPLNGKTMKPIELAECGPFAGEIGTLVGYGLPNENTHILPEVLQSVKVPVISDAECQKDYENLVKLDKSMVCAGYQAGGKDMCNGDSGGPLVVNGKLAGIVSESEGCAEPKFPGIYARVSELRTWIVTKANSFK